MKFPAGSYLALKKVLAADQTINYRGYQIDLSEHSGGWWYSIFPPGGEKNIGGVLTVPFEQREQAERSAKDDVEQHMANYGPSAEAASVLASDLYVEAAPRKAKDPALKLAEKKFDKPEMSEARFHIAKHRGLGMDSWEVTMNLPVSVNFLKAKEQDFQMNDFMRFNSSDPIEVLVMMANHHVEQLLGIRLGRASISTIDLARQRSKNGIKTVSMGWEVRDPIQAYALGMDLAQWGGASRLVESKEAYQKRLQDAQQTRTQAQELRKQVQEGQKTQDDWKAFLEAAKAKGMSYEITRPAGATAKLSSSYPALAKVLTS